MHLLHAAARQGFLVARCPCPTRGAASAVGSMGPRGTKRPGKALEKPDVGSGAQKLVAFDDAARLAGSHGVVVGVDEAGRGPLVGPVVAAAFCLTDPSTPMPDLLDDSKRMAATTRADVLRELLALQAAGLARIGVALAGPREIDRDNILASSLRAMERSVQSILGELGPDTLILVDGNRVPEGFMGEDARSEALGKLQARADAAQRKLNRQQQEADGKAPRRRGGGRDGESPPSGPPAPVTLPPPLVRDPVKRPAAESVVHGDARSAAIAAASVVAKETRDSLMRELDARFPGYGIAGHAGYPTFAHRSVLSQLGPSPAHRRTFQPLKSDFGWDWDGEPWAAKAVEIDAFHEYEWGGDAPSGAGRAARWDHARLWRLTLSAAAAHGDVDDAPRGAAADALPVPPAPARRKKAREGRGAPRSSGTDDAERPGHAAAAPFSH